MKSFTCVTSERHNCSTIRRDSPALVCRSTGHKGKFGHEFLEFEFRPDGKLRYANNSNYKGDNMIRKEGDEPQRGSKLERRRWSMFVRRDTDPSKPRHEKMLDTLRTAVFLNEGVLMELKRMVKESEIMK